MKLARGRGALASVLRTVRIEQEAVAALGAALEHSELRDAFEAAVAAIVRRSGRVIVTGMGKSGLIARKIAATMTSTGTPSLFLHPADASHGDLGMVAPGDVVLALTWSGETAELGDIINHCVRFGNTLIVVTSVGDSSAGRAADIRLELPAVVEACPNQLAPTSSTTVQVVFGDALAIALVERREFTASDFLVLHPGGRLGARLAVVDQLMGRGDAMPVVGATATITDAAIEMSRKRYGATAVVDAQGTLIGAFTDGDLRRCFATGALGDRIDAHMSPTPLSVPPGTLTAEALRIMNENAVSVLFVCEEGRLAGAIHLHDVLRIGVG
ncbi:SIS domain-containing protein [uncultured Sphingomonas sp.]|uniref:KpsF/GutQ family sugar-phosphate isomerase n=1 Tax=uncultured Sphingomonas sp. TaxID=158754 RepID=UPI0035CB57E0